MADVYVLRNTARRARRAWEQLNAVKDSPPASPRLARRMKPHFGPASPTPDGDWAVSLADSLLRETREDNVPGGLLVMARDALTTIGEHDRATDRDPVILCMHIAYTAGPICDAFPAADELAELLDAQADYIITQINHRYPAPSDGTGQKVRALAEGDRILTAAESARIAGLITGKKVTRKQVTYWGNAGYITTHYDSNGMSCYKLKEVVDYLQQYG